MWRIKYRKLGQFPNTMHIFRLFQFSTVGFAFKTTILYMCVCTTFFQLVFFSAQCFLFTCDFSLVYVYSSPNRLRSFFSLLSLLLILLLLHLFRRFFLFQIVIPFEFADDVHLFVFFVFLFGCFQIALGI